MNDLVRTDDHQLTTTTGAALAVRSDVDTDTALDLLQYASRWDNRKPSVAMAEAWAISAQLAGWTRAEAEDAIQHLQTHVRDYLTPAMVTARIESQRRRARLSEDGANPDGTRKVTFDAALEVWRDAFRSVGPNPSADQEAKAAELLEQMLDGAGDPVTVLNAAVLAGRKMSPRIDWTLERIANGEDRAQLVHRMPLCPVDFIRDDQLDVGYAVNQPDFPREWRLYDPLPESVHKLVREDLIPEWRSFNSRGRVPDFARPDRDVPDWLIEHATDNRYRDAYRGSLNDASLSDEERDEEAEQYRACRRRAHDWLDEDRARFERERLAVVRAWYAAHLNHRRAFEPQNMTTGWWDN